MKRKQYSKQFKLDAVRLLESSNKSGAEIARELGIRRNQLYKWRDQLERLGETEAFPGSCRNEAKDNRSELTRLRQRIARLEEENAILKKAEAYFTGKRR